jgi:cytidylate kinase
MHEEDEMSTAVVCISRTLGSGGEQIGRRVAEELGFAYADDEIIDRAAERAGVSRDAVAGAERPAGLISRMLEALAAAPMVSEGGAWTGMPGITPAAPITAGYEDLIRDVLRERAAQGNVVIVAHGGSMAVRDTGSVLRVLITAPPAVRIQRVISETNADENKAKKAVDESDKARQAYLKRFYGLDEVMTDYDLVVNTEILGADDAARLIVDAARH